MKFRILIFQILIVIILIALLFTSLSWILIHYQNPTDSVKEALTISVSFMGVLATVFAAFIALLVFKGWKDQANFELKKLHVDHLSTLLSMGYDENHKIIEILQNLAKLGAHEVLIEKYIKFIADDLRSEFYKTQINAKMLDRLNKKENDIFKHYAKYQTHFSELVERFIKIQNQYKIYYQNKIDIMDSVKKFVFENENWILIYESTNPNNQEHLILRDLLFRKVKFYGNNQDYEYASLEDMTNEMTNIYNILEKKVLDSIDLKIS